MNSTRCTRWRARCVLLLGISGIVVILYNELKSESSVLVESFAGTLSNTRDEEVKIQETHQSRQLNTMSKLQREHLSLGSVIRQIQALQSKNPILSQYTEGVLKAASRLYSLDSPVSQPSKKTSYQAKSSLKDSGAENIAWLRELRRHWQFAGGSHYTQSYVQNAAFQRPDGSWPKDPATGLEPKQCVILFGGPECGEGAFTGARQIISQAAAPMPPAASQELKAFRSFDPSRLRLVLFGDVPFPQFLIIPALHDYPQLVKHAVATLQLWIGRGGTAIFLGSTVNVYLMNQVLDTEVQEAWLAGPYVRNYHYLDALGNETLPDRLMGGGSTMLSGVLVGSLPSGSVSLYDSGGVSAALCIPLGFGRGCYVNAEFITNTTNAEEQDAWAQVLQAMMRGATCAPGVPPPLTPQPPPLY